MRQQIRLIRDTWPVRGILLIKRERRTCAENATEKKKKEKKREEKKMYKGIMKGSGSRRGNKNEEEANIYIYMEGVAEQSGEWNKWKRSDIGTAKLVRIQGSPFATRGKVGAAVTNRNGSWK